MSYYILISKILQLLRNFDMCFTILVSSLLGNGHFYITVFKFSLCLKYFYLFTILQLDSHNLFFIPTKTHQELSNAVNQYGLGFQHTSFTGTRRWIQCLFTNGRGFSFAAMQWYLDCMATQQSPSWKKHLILSHWTSHCQE